MPKTTTAEKMDIRPGTYERSERTVVSGDSTGIRAASTSGRSFAGMYHDVVSTGSRAGEKIRVAVTIKHSSLAEKIVETNRLLSGKGFKKP